MNIHTNDIGKSRGFIMGIAMIAVMLFHQHFVHDFPLSVLQHTGHWGVDVFLFVSGYGVAHSILSKKNYLSKQEIARFYLRRIIRIFPAIGCFTILRLLAGDIDSLYSGLICALGLNYWYIRYIYVLYALTPFFVYLIAKCSFNPKNFSYCIAGGCALILALILISIGGLMMNNLGFAIARLPVFLCGIHCYMWIGKIYKYNLVDIITAMMLLIISVLLVYKYDNEALFVRYYQYIFLVPAIVLFSSFIYRVKLLFPKFIIRFVEIIGCISLELYICHEYIFGKVVVCCFGYKGLVVAFSCSFIVAYFLHRISLIVGNALKKSLSCRL